MANLVKVFRRVGDITTLSAINEAVAIAASDGLYDNDVAVIQENTNRLRLHLKHTFALGAQDDGEPSGGAAPYEVR